MGRHVVPMEREERAHVMDRGGLDDMGPLEIVPARHGAFDAQLGWRVDEAEVGCDVRIFLIAGE